MCRRCMQRERSGRIRRLTETETRGNRHSAQIQPWSDTQTDTHTEIHTHTHRGNVGKNKDEKAIDCTQQTRAEETNPVEQKLDHVIRQTYDKLQKRN
jgi:hypothetical protein